MRRGTLNLSQATTMPAISPLFPDFPIVCKNVENISVAFETDLHAAAEVIPEVLELPEECTAYFNILRIPESGMGAYNEATLVLEVLWKGELARYNVLQFVDNDMAFALGREVLGSPKKLAHIAMDMRPEGMLGFCERPQGNRILTLGLSLDEAVDTNATTSVPGSISIGLRLIPQPEGQTPSVTADLIGTQSTWRLSDQWTGRGFVNFSNGTNQLDDWQILPVIRIKRAAYSKFSSIVIPRPRLLAHLS